MLCRKDSYRIGGDEFAVVLINTDNVIIKKDILLFETDIEYMDVFRRADSTMYEDKKRRIKRYGEVFLSMRKKMLLFACSVILCTSMIGCSIPKEEENNSIESVIEDNSIENVTETNNIISPLPVTIDINNLDNCTVAVSLEQGDAYVDDTGAMQMDVTVYTYDLYDMVDIASLKEGDIIVIREQEVKVTSLEQNDYGTILINGGLECNGFELSNNDSGVWFESGYNDVKSFYEIGKKTIRVSPDFEFCDSSDLDKGEIIYYPGDFLTDDAGIVYHFIPNNTSIVIENGMIIKMYRNYIP